MKFHFSPEAEYGLPDNIQRNRPLQVPGGRCRCWRYAARSLPHPLTVQVRNVPSRLLPSRDPSALPPSLPNVGHALYSNKDSVNEHRFYLECPVQAYTSGALSLCNSRRWSELKKIMLDAGHGPATPGKRTPDGS